MSRWLSAALLGVLVLWFLTGCGLSSTSGTGKGDTAPHSTGLSSDKSSEKGHDSGQATGRHHNPG